MTGNCKYCGQTFISTEEEKEKADYDATMNCKCDGSRLFAQVEDLKTSKKAIAETIFPEADNETMKLILNAVNLVAENRVENITVKVDDNVKAIVKGSSEELKVIRDYHERTEY